MEESTALLSYLTISIVFFFYLLLRRPTTTNHCPYPNPILGNLLPFFRNRHRFLDWAVDLFHHSPTSTIQVITPLSFSNGVATANPLVVDHLLRSNFPKYIKGHRIRSALYDLVGDGLLAADGSLWFHQRKIASREFTTRSLRSFIADVVKSHLEDRLLPLLSSAADSVVDFQDLLRRFAFDNICAVAFGTDPCSLLQNQNQNRHQSFIDAFDEAVEISYARLFAPLPWIWKAKRILNLGSERRLRSALNVIDDYAMRIVESRKESREVKKQDLLSRFMVAMEEDGNELGAMFENPMRKRRFLRDVVVSFVLAGKDSTSSGLTWFFWLLSKNPRCKSRIYDEISQQQQQGGEEESKGMHYLHAAITEALRLYPPVPIDSRVAAVDDVLPDGTKVKAGWFTDYSAYAMGRSEEIWGPEKEEFLPERWLDAKGEFAGADAARFPVFHAGPRSCLGKEMAYLQMKTVAVAVMRRFEVEPAAEEKPGPPYEVAVTLRMKGGFPVRIKRRA
ncbi:cytochrome P450 94A2-like [Typha angustifolia]|uniref:cytochrome P450 94A2-like n=1 Tax=Typha angustifolia TaxID=59011 RepID=UPI003C2F7378